MLIDSHCHLADDAFAGDLGAVIGRARAAGLAGALCILDATSDEEIARAASLRASWPDVWFSVGIHPHRAGRVAGDPDAALRALAACLDGVEGTVALGEIGLDYHYDFAPREVQRTVFARQLALARDRGLPVVIHAREADADVVDVVRESGQRAGVFHCFTGDVSFARQALDLGFHVSLSGIVTFPRAEGLREVARFVPGDRLLAETDSPYLAPVPYRGKRNEPAWVTRVVEGLGGARGVAPEAVASGTGGNFAALFGLPGAARRVDSPEGSVLRLTPRE